MLRPLLGAAGSGSPCPRGALQVLQTPFAAFPPTRPSCPAAELGESAAAVLRRVGVHTRAVISAPLPAPAPAPAQPARPCAGWARSKHAATGKQIARSRLSNLFGVWPKRNFKIARCVRFSAEQTRGKSEQFFTQLSCGVIGSHQRLRR